MRSVGRPLIHLPCVAVGGASSADCPSVGRSGTPPPATPRGRLQADSTEYPPGRSDLSSSSAPSRGRAAAAAVRSALRQTSSVLPLLRSDLRRPRADEIGRAHV